MSYNHIHVFDFDGVNEQLRELEQILASQHEKITALEAERDAAWNDVVFQNSWVNWGGAYATAQYRRSNGMIQVQGLVKNGTLNSTICTLPVGFRPKETHLILTTDGNYAGENTNLLSVQSDGQIIQLDGETNSWVSLGNMSMKAA